MPSRKNSSFKKSLSHIIRQLGGVAYKTAAVFIMLLITSHIISLTVLARTSAVYREKFTHAISEKLSLLAFEGDEIAVQTDLVEKMQNLDAEGLAAYVQDQADEREISNVIVTDMMGFVQTRTLSPDRFGDNIFLTSASGRALQRDDAVVSIEKRIFVDELSLMTGRYITSQGERIGALFANQFIDGDLMRFFRDNLFSSGTQLAAYTFTGGVYESTFDDSSEDATVRSYFHAESSWIAFGESDKTLRFESGHFYDVINIVFSGLEEDTGGVLIFVPRTDLSFARNIFIMLVTLGVFTVLLRRAHIGIPREMRGWLYSLLLFLSVTPIVLFSWSLFVLQEVGYTALERVSYPIYNSTLSIEPSWGILDVGSSQEISFVVLSGDEAINAVQIKAFYDSDLVSVDRIDLSESPCSYVIDASIHPDEGYVVVSCVLLGKTEGMSNRLAIADIQFTPREPGNINFVFDDQFTQVLANDGLGTNVLRSTTDASYHVDTFNFSESEEAQGRSFIVFSPTHPNQARWYSADRADFMWLGNKGDSYRYVFDQNPETVPEYGDALVENSISIPLLMDGVYYFHMQSIQGGPVAHYRIQVDTDEPRIVTADVSDRQPHVGDVVRFSFLAMDALSGVQHNYYLDLGNGLFLPVGEDVYIPFLEKGEKHITLHVFDEANNVAEQKLTLTVQE